jgi:protease I
VALKDVEVGDYDRIGFIGGPGAAALKAEPHALRVAREAFEAGMPLGAICIAPTILAAAGVLQGKRATVWEGGRGEERAEIQKRGAIPTAELVTIDGTVVTGNGPDAALAFGQALAAL